MSGCPLHTASALALLLASLPASAQEGPGPWAVVARLGVLQPARLNEPPNPAPGLGTGPNLEVGLSRGLLPWLEVELAVGWSRSQAPTERFLVSSNPADPMAPIALLLVEPRLTTASIIANVRARWPATWAVRPYLVAGGGPLYADLLIDTDNSPAYPTRDATGWGPALQAGFGADLRPWNGLLLGVEARWRWSHATLREHVDSSSTLYASSRSGDVNLGAFSLQATVGWAF
jgi:hypothetical protein